MLLTAGGWIGWNTWQGSQASTDGLEIGGPFSLTDQNSQSFTDADLKGRPTLLYFGYSYCPDVCPTSLLLMETAVEILGPSAAQKVNIVFITIDPERDTPQLMKGFVPNFGPTIVGLTGSPDQIAAVARAYKVFYRKVPSRDDGPYLMDHSSIVYLLDRKGRFIEGFTHESTAEDIARALRKIM